MNKVKKLLDFTLIGLLAFLFFIFLFESKLEVPNFLISAGRLHPLLLHLPIGIFAAAGLLILFQREFEPQALNKIFSFLILISAFTATLTAIFGLILSKEGGYDPTSLDWHKWLGIVFAFLCTWYYMFWQFRPATERTGVYFLTLVIMAVAGHYGGELTHGESYLFPVEQNKAETVFDPQKPIYQSAIRPILEKKCVSCHNDQKAKGGLNMKTLSLMIKGGKNGPLWIHGKPLESQLMQRLLLPEDDKKHMPPKGKPQPNNLEITLLSQWIASGADTLITFNALTEKDTLKYLISQIYPRKALNVNKSYSFGALDESEIENLNTPFLKVEALALGSPALKASFYVSQKFDKESLKKLEKAGENLVELSLNKMPLTDEDLELVARFQNLEKLSLNQTNITGKTFSVLSKLKYLESLSLSGCALQESTLSQLSSLKSLKELFVWSTGLPASSWDKLKKQNPKLHIELGYVPDPTDKLKLNPPMVVNKTRLVSGNEKAELKHSLPGVKILYTTDGSVPDTVNGNPYKMPLEISGYTTINAVAVKEGWLASDVRNFSFFRSRATADSAILISPTNKEYPGKGGKTIIDLKQGDIDNFRDGSWLGYKDNRAEFLVKSPKTTSHKGLTLSYLIDAGSFIMPPVEVEIWGGETPEKMSRLEVIRPEQLTKIIPKQAKGLSIDLKSTYTWYKFVAKPIPSLPVWHPGKGQKGWFFVDEIYFW